jgi:hypothetical protein
MKKGIYDHAKAAKLFQYLVDNGARKYVKEHGAPGQNIRDVFPKAERTKVAQKLADAWHKEYVIEQGNMKKSGAAGSLARAGALLKADMAKGCAGAEPVSKKKKKKKGR